MVWVYVRVYVRTNIYTYGACIGKRRETRKGYEGQRADPRRNVLRQLPTTNWIRIAINAKSYVRVRIFRRPLIFNLFVSQQRNFASWHWITPAEAERDRHVTTRQLFNRIIFILRYQTLFVLRRERYQCLPRKFFATFKKKASSTCASKHAPLKIYLIILTFVAMIGEIELLWIFWLGRKNYLRYLIR